jgi:urea transporter
MGVADFVSGNPGLDFFYILFNGISEVPLFSSPVTGILILIGVFIASRNAGIMMVISGLIGAGMAILLGAPYGLVAFGLFAITYITGMAFCPTSLNLTRQHSLYRYLVQLFGGS